VRQNLEVRAGYDTRFGTIAFDVQSRFGMNAREFLASLNIDPNDFAALMEDRYQWTEGDADIEGARVRLLEETDWQGKTVLDVGGYDGFAAEIAHKGGAARAICLDNQQYGHYGWETKRKEGVEYVTGDGFEWKEPVDVVILYNVLYHCWDPLALLRHLRGLCKGEMLVCSLFRYHKGAWAYFYEGRECNPTDESVIWGPSLACLERWFANTGWEADQYALSHDRVLYRCKPTLEPQGRQSKY
jgi:SAM-dependent methyltransferase